MSTKDDLLTSMPPPHNENVVASRTSTNATRTLKDGGFEGEQTDVSSSLVFRTSHECMDIDDTINTSSSKEATAAEGQQERTEATSQGHNFAAAQCGTSLPMFPPLSMKQNDPPTSLDSMQTTPEDSQEIAKEAMRLTKQTLLRHQKTGYGQINPRLSMVLPIKLAATSPRLNKFVRRLHDMLSKEGDSGLVEWRRGLLVLKSTGYFAKNILPKYFNTRNFKTFRRQLNYYGFVHIRSFSNAEQSTCALWVNGELSKIAMAAGVDPNDVASVLLLRRVEMADQATTNEMRRMRKELAISTIEKDLGISAKALQLQTLTSLGALSSLQQTTTAPTACSYGQEMSGTVSDASSESSIDKGPGLVVKSVTYKPCSSVVSADDDEAKPPASNASAANLLLLLSKA